MSKKIKKTLIIFITVIVTVMLSFLVVVGATTTTKTVVVRHERLDTGVIFVWDNGKGVWQNGLAPGSKNVPYSASLNIGKGDYSNFKFDVYIGSNFSFSSDETCHWNKTSKCKNKDDYHKNYLDYSVQFTDGIAKYNKDKGVLTLNETVNLVSKENFDVAYYIRKHQQKEIYDYLGGDLPPNMQKAINKMNLDPSIKGYLYFLPVVVTYDETKTITIPSEPIASFMAALGLPPKSYVGESFTIVDKSEFENPNEFKKSKLDYSTDGGKTWVEVEEWDGSELGSDLKVLTRRDPDKDGYFELSYDGGKTWVDGGKLKIE